MARIVCLGEAMLELARGETDWAMGYGGDTLNTAVHLARYGQDVAYMTALGTDAFSAELVQAWEGEGLESGLVLRHPTRQPGLYAIATDPSGERSFTYWRDSSAAKAMFELGGATGRACAEAGVADLFCFSLISLAILPDEGRARLLDLAQAVRANGGKVAFDGNYRARLWESAEAARSWRDRAIACADFGFPTLEDETALSGEDHADAVAKVWLAQGCAEVVVKMGADGCRLAGGEVIPPERRLVPVDTSGAGDAFNAGYLAGRMAGNGPADSARMGHQLAGWVVMRRGAIPERDPGAPYAVRC